VVRVVTPRGDTECTVRATATVTRGTVEIDLNAIGGELLESLVLEADAVVTEIRLESR
jgi:hypothetical protein